MAGAIGSFGDYVFSVHERGGAVTFNSVNRGRNARLVTHATIDGAPIVEFLGLDAETIQLSGKIVADITGDVDAALDELRALQDGQSRPLTRGSRYYGLFVVRSFTYSEDEWAGAELVSATWRMELVSTREAANG